MLPLVFAMGILLAPGGAQQLPCDLVPEHELPKCRFIDRSNYALHGRVHTARTTTQQIAPDPRVVSNQSGRAAPAPKLSLNEPQAWIVFSLDGELIENAGSLEADGNPSKPYRKRTTREGNKTVTVSGPPDDPDANRTEETSDGADRVEHFVFQHGKLISHHIAIQDGGHETESSSYDADDNLLSHANTRYDASGRAVEWRVVRRDRLVIDERDTYDDSGDDDEALISRAWFDENGALSREITLRNARVNSWWQRPDCGAQCTQTASIGFNRPFDSAVDYELQPDGSLFTTVENHKGRYGNIENDDVELRDQDGALREKIAFRYSRDEKGNWTERTTAVLDRATGKMIDVRVDKRDLTYWGEDKQQRRR